MIDIYNTPVVNKLDKVIEHSIISGMKEIATTLTEAQIAITMLERLANSKRITRQDLAEKLNVNRVTVGYWFNNKTTSLENYINTAQAIGANPADILQQAINIHNQQAESALAGKDNQ